MCIVFWTRRSICKRILGGGATHKRVIVYRAAPGYFIGRLFAFVFIGFFPLLFYWPAVMYCFFAWSLLLLRRLGVCYCCIGAFSPSVLLGRCSLSFYRLIVSYCFIGWPVAIVWSDGVCYCFIRWLSVILVSVGCLLFFQRLLVCYFFVGWRFL